MAVRRRTQCLEHLFAGEINADVRRRPYIAKMAITVRPGNYVPLPIAVVVNAAMLNSENEELCSGQYASKRFDCCG
ncbi:hypothetical protein E4U55_003809 [Claviceps digitariae]|nr:hypothetical protein E4U55_003809 [Claviceps digitariae]